MSWYKNKNPTNRLRGMWEIIYNFELILVLVH